MISKPERFDHVFRYRNRVVRLICSIELEDDERRLILDDVLASSESIANAVPDWKIEAEAMNAAYDRSAKYM